MATGGEGGHQIKWTSEREMMAAIAAGIRVVRATTGYQVQVLEVGEGGEVRVAHVVPGDQRHAALYQTLVTPESEWGIW